MTTTRTKQADTILRRRSKLCVWFFEHQFARQLKRQFTAVRLSRNGGLPDLTGKRLVVYSNHASWWDAIVYFHLGRTLFRDRTGYGPIDAAELRRYPVLNRLGLFGIERDSFGGAAQFLAIARLVLAKSDTMLWITAEGQFTDSRPRPLALQPGIAHLAAATPDIVFLPLAIEYGFWNSRRPELLLRFGALVTATENHRTLLNTLTESLATTMNALAEEAITRDADRFDILLGGKSGIHPLYDLLRRGS